MGAGTWRAAAVAALLLGGGGVDGAADRAWAAAGNGAAQERDVRTEEVEVTVRSVLLDEEAGGERSRRRYREWALAYVEARLVGPFFDRGRSEELTMRLVPFWSEETRHDHDSYRWRDPYGEDPWGALDWFSGGEVQFWRGTRLLLRVPQEMSMIRVEGLSYSPRTGLLNVHLLQANIGIAPSSLDVLRYDPATDGLERRTYSPAGEPRARGPWLMDCGEDERPWVPSGWAESRAVFTPCRSDLELWEAYHELAATVRTWGSGMLYRDSGATDLSCAECPAPDEETFCWPSRGSDEFSTLVDGPR